MIKVDCWWYRKTLGDIQYRQEFCKFSIKMILWWRNGENIHDRNSVFYKIKKFFQKFFQKSFFDLYVEILHFLIDIWKFLFCLKWLFFGHLRIVLLIFWPIYECFSFRKNTYIGQYLMSYIGQYTLSSISPNICLNIPIIYVFIYRAL